MDAILSFVDDKLPFIWEALLQTLKMLGISLFFSVLLGLPMGILLILTSKGGAWRNRFVYEILNLLINMIRSIPFIILLFFILPFTKLLVGSSIGVKGVIVPLVVYATPFFARIMETALLEVERGVIEAYKAMGIGTRQIIWHVMLREARPSIMSGLTIGAISLLGATAMAGLVGAGGLGDVAYRYGHLRYEVDVMYVTVFMLIVLVQGIQMFGNSLVRRFKKD